MPTQQDREVATQLYRLDRVRHTVLQHGRLAIADLRLLWLLSDGEARSLRAIGEALRLEQSTVNRQVNAAIRAGLLVRHTPEGAGAALVLPTEEGLRRYEEESELSLRLVADGLESLGEHDAAVFVALLHRFTCGYESAVSSR